MCELYHIFFDLPCPSDEKSLYFKNIRFRGQEPANLNIIMDRNICVKIEDMMLLSDIWRMK